MITTKLEECGNCGEGKFSVGGRQFEVRHSTIGEMRSIQGLINTEAEADKIFQLLPSLQGYMRDTPQEKWTKSDVAGIIRRSKVQDPLVDLENPKSVNRQINAGLTFVTVAFEDAAPKIVGHMWGEDLSEHGVPGFVEITAGVVDDKYRDGNGARERLNIQNRNRFALLNEIASRYPDGTYIISISKQPLVALPLEASGFVEMPEEQCRILPKCIWTPGWKARYTTVGMWKTLTEDKALKTPEDYNDMISEYVRAKRLAENLMR